MSHFSMKISTGVNGQQTKVITLKSNLAPNRPRWYLPALKGVILHTWELWNKLTDAAAHSGGTAHRANCRFHVEEKHFTEGKYHSKDRPCSEFPQCWDETCISFAMSHRVISAVDVSLKLKHSCCKPLDEHDSSSSAVSVFSDAIKVFYVTLAQNIMKKSFHFSLAWHFVFPAPARGPVNWKGQWVCLNSVSGLQRDSKSGRWATLQ